MSSDRIRKTVSALLFLGTVFVFTAAQTPRTAENFMDRGLERQTKGDIEGAIEDFSKVISMKPQALILAAAYNNRANARASKNDLAGAIADYSSAIEVLPSHPENYYNRGSLLLGKGDYDRAIADFSKAIEI